jgi:hypothetical protein
MRPTRTSISVKKSGRSRENWGRDPRRPCGVCAEPGTVDLGDALFECVHGDSHAGLRYNTG